MDELRKTGRVTIPTDLDVVPETLEILKKWGADAIRDCDGTDFPQQLKDADAKIYSTYYTTRKDNAWAKANPDEVQQCYIMTGFYTAPGDTVTIPLMKGISPELMQVNTNDDISLMYFTSGTTGNPKMVAHDFTYPLAHIITGKYWHNLDENSLHFTLADTGWGKAVWGKLYGQWIAGANVFVYDFEKFVPAEILEMIEKYHITSFCAPPTVFRFLLHDEAMGKYDISSLKYCTIAGEALNPEVYKQWLERTGIKLMEGYGQTETTLIIASYPWIEPKSGSMGIRNPQYDIDLVDAEGNSVPDGEEGQIVIRTHGKKVLGLFKEYYRDAERTREAWHDGLYYTGDVAWRDEDGYLWFVGRADDVIKSSGYRIGPFEVESALMTHPAVVECAITGVPDEIRGQVVKATIVLAKDYKDKAGDALVKELQDHVKKVTAPYKYPRVVEFVDELPKTISGKIRRVEIRATDNEKKHTK